MSIYTATLNEVTKMISKSRRLITKQAAGKNIVFLPQRDEISIVTHGQTTSLVIKIYYIKEDQLETITVSYEWRVPDETF